MNATNPPDFRGARFILKATGRQPDGIQLSGKKRMLFSTSIFTKFSVTCSWARYPSSEMAGAYASFFYLLYVIYAFPVCVFQQDSVNPPERLDYESFVQPVSDLDLP